MALGLTQEALAHKMGGYSRNYVSMLERGTAQAGKRFLRQLEVLEKDALRPKGHAQNLALREDPLPMAGSKSANPDVNVGPRTFKKTRKIRVLSMVQAGTAMEYETTPEAWEDVVDYDGPDAGAFALRTHGDSMLPRFPTGTVIVVSPQCPPSYGDFVAAYIRDEGGLFKRLKHTSDAKTVRLESLNPEYPLVERPREDFEWIFRVVEARLVNL